MTNTRIRRASSLPSAMRHVQRDADLTRAEPSMQRRASSHKKAGKLLEDASLQSQKRPAAPAARPKAPSVRPKSRALRPEGVAPKAASSAIAAGPQASRLGASAAAQAPQAPSGAASFFWPAGRPTTADKLTMGGASICLVGVLVGFAVLSPLLVMCSVVGCILIVGIGPEVPTKAEFASQQSQPNTTTANAGPTLSYVVPLNTLPIETLIEPPEELDSHITMLMHPERFASLVADMRPGILMTGPPGTGKTAAVRAAALRYNAQLIHLKHADFVSSMYGQSEKELTRRLQQADTLARSSDKPTILFMDELDLLVTNRNADSDKSRGQTPDRRLLDVFLQFMDGMGNKDNGRLIVMACTNKPGDIDDALSSRFGSSVAFKLPKESVRRAFCAQRLEKLSHTLTPRDIDWLAKNTATFNFREISTVLRQAGLKAASEGASALSQAHIRQVQRAFVKTKDSEVITDLIVPLERLPAEELIDAPKDLDSHLAIMLQPERFDALILDMRPGLLMTGPPGTGKTASVRAAALRLNANLVHLKNSDFMSSYYGSTETKLAKRLQQVQTLVRTSDKPTILFIDELDLMVPSRSPGVQRGNFSDSRILDVFLQFMDGMDGSGNQRLAVIACTNKPEDLDAALASRFGGSIEFALPKESARRAFCQSRLQKLNHALAPVDIERLAHVTPTYNYRDLQTLLSRAGLNAVADSASAITWTHVLAALCASNQRKLKSVNMLAGRAGDARQAVQRGMMQAGRQAVR